jgi:hypothetical protein
MRRHTKMKRPTLISGSGVTFYSCEMDEYCDYLETDVKILESQNKELWEVLRDVMEETNDEYIFEAEKRAYKLLEK